VPHPALRLPVAVVAALSLLLAMTSALVAAGPARAATTDLIISEYVEGSGSNKAVEIYNGTGGPVNLADYRLELYSNGSATASNSFSPAATLADDDVYVIANPSAPPALLALADATTGGAINFNGDDALVLRKGGAAGSVVDSLGQVGVDPGTQWGAGTATTLDHTLRRDSSVLAGDTDPSNAFDPADQWQGFPIDTFDGLGTHTVDGGPDSAPTVTATTPASDATDVATAANVNITFAEPVDTASGWYSISCSTSGAHTATVTETSGGGARTLDPDVDLAIGETCTVAVTAADVTDRDTVDPPDAMAGDYSFSFATVTANACDTAATPIHDIQGTGPTNTANNETRSTEGIVTGDFQGDAGMRGFFIQDPDPDTDPLTSEGVFIFVPPASPFFSLALSAGDTVHLRGRVTEFQNQTEIDTLDQLVVCGTGTDIAPSEVTLPVTNNGDLERYEGMKVSLPQTMTVQQNFFQGRFGQLSLGAGGRLYQPTNQFRAGSPETQALADLNHRSMIVLDDATTAQNPNPVPYLPADGIRRAGDSVSGIEGILDEGPINSDTTIRGYRVQPTMAPTFSQDNGRTDAPPSVGGNLKVAFFNVLNYFTTLDDANAPAGLEPRGANTAREFDRQRTKIFAAMSAIDAGVFGLSEIENLPGTHAVQNLVDGLNAYVGAPGRYAAVADPVTGTGSDAIKVALIYQPAKVATVGASLSDPDVVNNRAPIAQTFRLLASGERVNVVVNHLKSKGSCPTATDPDAAGNTDSGDGQGCWNARRVQQAQRLLSFIDTVKATSGDADVLAIGDFNSYGHEDPIETLTAAGLDNELARFVGAKAYSYVFDGLSGYLDHSLATPSADLQMVGAAEWHINADEPSVIDYNTEFKPDDRYTPSPYRSSDHDPVVLGVDLGRCRFSDDARHRVRTLTGDCTTSTTVTVPNGWTLEGAGHTITAYDPAGGHFRGAVVANAGSVANVRDVRITGYRLADVCDAGVDALRGILLDGASGVLAGNRVVDLRQGASGCQEGNGIEVRNAPFTTRGRDVVVAVTGNEVRGYQKTGIAVNGSVLTLVHGNTVQGSGKVPYIAQNGVQVAFGAAGVVSHNTITNNYYTGAADAQACGVLLSRDDHATQLGNTFAGNQHNVCRVS
jgi:predicted extracellular nuclease